MFGKDHKGTVAKLTPDELRQILENERVLDDVRRIHILMAQGQKTLWWSLKQKYNLPEDIDFNRQTGEIAKK